MLERVWRKGCSWSATKRLAHRSFSTKSLTSGIKKKKKKKTLIPTNFYLHMQARLPCPALAPCTHSHTCWSPKHTNSSNPQPSGYWRYHNSFFSQRQARKDDRNYVCSQKTGLNWFRRGKKLSCVFFFLPLAKDLGTFDVQSAGIFKKRK